MGKPRFGDRSVELTSVSTWIEGKVPDKSRAACGYH
jgi:hypothetical protein